MHLPLTRIGDAALLWNRTTQNPVRILRVQAFCACRQFRRPRTNATANATSVTLFRAAPVAPAAPEEAAGTAPVDIGDS